MKKLFLLRHAKSSWDDASLADFDRPLNERGKKSAPLMGRMMKERGGKPDVILCSPSKRTKQTAKLFLDESHLKTPVSFEDGIYEASTKGLISILKKQDDDTTSILMIGHNPGMEDLLSNLTGEYEHFPTATLAHIDLDLKSWKEIKRGTGKLQWILRPKEIS